MKAIIVGAGEVGYQIASRFAHENKDVVVIDKDPQAIRRVSENIDVQAIQGSGSSPLLLEAAGIKEAEILLAVTDSDEVNLVACLAANCISPTTKKLARLRNADYDEYHDVFREQPPHIDTVINPEIEVVKTIVRLISIPDAEDVGEFADGRLKLVGIRLDEASPLAGVQLQDLGTHVKGHPPLVTAIIRGDELIIPRGDDRLMPKDLIYFISDAAKYKDYLTLFGKRSEPIRRALIVGGGRIGLRLATVLEETGIYIKIMEKDAERCRELAEKLNRSVVLHADGSDRDLLNEENIQDMDVVVTATDEEETNIIVSLLARGMGAPKTITRISRFSYFPLLSTIGIQQVVSPRLSAINTILQHIRRGKVLSAISIKGEQAEVLEAVALKTSEIVGKPLAKVKFPKDALVAAIMRGDDIIIPSGDTVIHPDDRIIIFARREAIAAVEKILTVKLEYF